MSDLISQREAAEALDLSPEVFRNLADSRGWHSEPGPGHTRLYRRSEVATHPRAVLKPAKTVTERKCLRCTETFPSWGVGNRLCDACRDFARRFRSALI